ncbi:MAG: DJ-1/PfpI family protein [Acidobacteriota bacterium]
MTKDDLRRRSVGILLFENVEVLDFAGPFEVFSRARLEPGAPSRRSEDSAPFDVFTVSASGERLEATGGLVVEPKESFASAPPIDILLVPGGFGTRALTNHEPTISWIRERAAAASLVTSVCTGALLLAEAGLLEGRRATTHHGALELLRRPGIDVVEGVRVVEDGVVSSAGVAAGIDMAFHVVSKLCGEAVARETAEYIEYPYPEGLPAGAVT